MRLFLIEVVERACVNDVFGHAAACLATLETCLEDEDVKVRRKACVAATVLFATTFKFLYLCMFVFVVCLYESAAGKLDTGDNGVVECLSSD